MRIVRGIIGLIGELLITLGAVTLAYVVWQLWWTDVVSETDARQAVVSLQAEFQEKAPEQVELGDAFAIVRIPRFGTDYARPLYEGTDRETLKRGIGHYPESAKPGDIGNFAMAGHRTTYGKPFSLIHEFRPGDAIIIETGEGYYVYEKTEDLIVYPHQVEVVLPVPSRPGVAPKQAVVTLTSCHPQFSSRQRWVTHGVFVGFYTLADGIPQQYLEVS